MTRGTNERQLVTNQMIPEAAVVSKGLAPRPYTAWCEFCQDGMRYGVAKKARAWAADHNRVRHEDAK